MTITIMLILAMSAQHSTPDHTQHRWTASDKMERDWPVLSVSVGIAATMRQASIRGQSSPGTLDYHTTGFVPGLVLTAKNHPFMLINNSRLWLKPLEVSLETVWSSIQTLANNEKTTRSIRQMRFALHYRMLPNTPHSKPFAGLRLGYSYIAYPLDTTVFPAIHYHLPQVGLQVGYLLSLNTPFVDTIIVDGIFDYGLSIVPSAVTARLGEQESGTAWRANLSATIIRSRFYVTLKTTLERIHNQFSGTTNLNRVRQLSRVALDDPYLGSQLLVGVRF